MSNRNGPSKGGKSSSSRLGQKPRSGKPTSKTADKPFAFETDPRPRMNAPRKERLAQPLDDMRMGEFVVDRLGHDGRGIASWNGKTLFIKGALPGERVSTRLVRTTQAAVVASCNICRWTSSSPSNKNLCWTSLNSGVV
jgi:23S rRNA (uracil1939-C5)-methyltransferase